MTDGEVTIAMVLTVGIGLLMFAAGLLLGAILWA